MVDGVVPLPSRQPKGDRSCQSEGDCHAELVGEILIALASIVRGRLAVEVFGEALVPRAMASSSEMLGNVAWLIPRLLLRVANWLLVAF